MNLVLLPGCFPAVDLGQPRLDAADGLEQLRPARFGDGAPERREVAAHGRLGLLQISRVLLWCFKDTFPVGMIVAAAQRLHGLA